LYYGQWTSLHPEIAKVASKTGIVTGIALGTASLVVSFGTKADTVMVTVGTREVAPLTVSPASAHLSVSDTAQLATSLDVPKNGTPNPSAAPLQWESSDTKVVTVSSAGLLSAKGPGRATVVVRSGSQSVRVAVTVVAKELPVPTSNPGTPGRPRIPGAGEPELPRVRLDSRYVAPSGKTIVVREGGDLQHALDAASPGDVISLEAGATFTGNFTLPRKSGSGWITLRSATPDASLPREGERMTPDRAAGLARIVTPNAMPAISTGKSGGSHYRIMAVEITAVDTLRRIGTLVELGNPSNASLDRVASNLIIDRAYIHGHPDLHLHRCVALNSASTSIVDSYLDRCHGKGMDTQAIAGWNGPGPYKIVNNYLAGAGENVIFGGADPRIPNLVPSDIEIRRNYFHKPVEWRAERKWSVKNLLELKNAQRVLIEGNVFENSWPDAQIGFGFVFWSVNQSNRCTWCVTQDVTFRNNVVKNVAGGFQLNARSWWAPTKPMQRVAIVNNLILGVGTYGKDNGRLYQIAGDIQGLTIEHNTGFGSVHSFLFDPKKGYQASGVVIRDNISGGGRYQVFSSDGQGEAALRLYGGDDYVFDGNIIVGGSAKTMPSDNFYPKTIDEIGLTDPDRDNLRLSARSTYRSRATDGTDPGADIDAIERATAGVAPRGR
jgi:hypothetical protein